MRGILLGGVVAAGTALSGCPAGNGAEAGRRAPATGPASAATSIAAPVPRVLRGRATYAPQVKMPPGASLVVELVAGHGPTPGVVAGTTVRNVAGPPIAFELPVRASAARAGEALALRARLVGPDGELWFRTASLAPVTLDHGAPITLTLVRVEANPPPAPPAATEPMHWSCDELGVMSRPGTRPGHLKVSANGWDWEMAATGSPGRYGDVEGNAFRIEADSARLMLAGDRPRDCVPASMPSPWNRTLLDGLRFRGVGNEPGWYVEVGTGERPRLRAVVDYGERELIVPAAVSQGAGFEGVSASGAPVRLRIEHTACRDVMSGQRFEATVRLTVDGSAYEGCGAFLGR